MMEARDMAIDYKPRLFTAEEYHRMGEAGVFGPDERVELLDGEIIAAPPMGDRHAAGIERLTHLLVRRFGENASIRPALPVKLSAISEPQPDFALAKRRSDAYRKGGVHTSDVLALIEVSDSSLGYDRRKKLHAYARAGIAEYWVVNLVDETVEQFRDPNDVGYASSFVAHRGERVSFVAFPSEAIGVDEILG